MAKFVHVSHDKGTRAINIETIKMVIYKRDYHPDVKSGLIHSLEIFFVDNTSEILNNSDCYDDIRKDRREPTGKEDAYKGYYDLTGLEVVW